MSQTTLTRRTMLRLLGAGAGALTLASCGFGSRSGSGGGAAAPAPEDGGALTEPQVLTSSGGRLEVRLKAAPTMLPWSRGQRYALTYDGSVPGPTLRVRPGDTLVITLENGLDAPTNLHTHGLHVSPAGDGDNVFVMVQPGGSHTYTYRIPADHPAGLFWYHPHHHGRVAPQLSGGMAGALVVSDATDVDPVLAAAEERVLLLSDPAIGSDASVLEVSAAERRTGREGPYVLVNGGYQPEVRVAAGTVERWRILNACSSRFQDLSLSSGPLTVIGTSQGLLGSPVTTEAVRLVPGQRVDVLVPVGSDRLRLTSTTVARGGMGGMGMGGAMADGGGMGTATSPSAGSSQTLLTLAPTGTATAPTLGRVSVAPVRPAERGVDRTRAVTMGAMGMGDAQFVIDGRSFDPGRIDTTVALGSVEEWTISNASMMDHPFHVHVWPFTVVARSDGDAEPGWHDTVNVPTGGWVRIRVPITDFAGTTVYHCHVLDHEDLGMMGTIEAT